ncbi:hypothetical protein TrCOL_g7520 [Triparma columacea]|uniref:methylmalonate-semialdehyde dehydrogenase (CoA acylating) n=1 Tax=Triparma columacea TaxID=722753 RepID=A0A9W7L738_9STRA|nr:hypothetical protein TrCOL_g7520 [Triparma columacea]
MNCNNWINNAEVEPKSGEYMDVTSPSTGEAIGKCAVSNSADVEAAIAGASSAFPAWSGLTMKARAGIMLKFYSLVKAHADTLAECIVKENGKNITEGLADVAKGLETVEYAISLPQVAQGKSLTVSRGINCTDTRRPLGVVAAIVPFNFPFMVPMWTVPISLVLGNTVVLKPSEKCPMTLNLVRDLIVEAGFPAGVWQMVNGTRECCEALIDSPLVKAVSFVGSSPIAKSVSVRCHGLNKRVIALGGAKNHLIALKDADLEGTTRDVVASFAGASGQRCMAASVLLVVGENDELINNIVQRAGELKLGTDKGEMGPVIDGHSFKKINSYLEASEASGAKLLLDGRSKEVPKNGGNWIGPTVILHEKGSDKALHDEIFGPVLSILKVKTWQDAIAIENANPFGNAACIYTSKGGSADWFTQRFMAGMLGVNIGIPVPREPFAFGGLYGTLSKYGDGDITGEGAIEFFSTRIKITTRWPVPVEEEFEPEAPLSDVVTDHANFNGRM